MMKNKGPSRKAPATLSALDLFSGCGGLTEGIRQAGFSVIGAVDIDALSMRCYELNHSKVPTWETDIAAISGAELLRRFHIEAGTLDLVAGCPPCQGFSALRTLNGSRRVRDDRNNLIRNFGELILAARPKAVLMENVPGLAGDRRFKDFVATLTAAEYQVQWGVLDAADYGVPQRRRRLILTAGLAGKIPFPRPARRRRVVREVLQGLAMPGVSGDKAHDHLEHRSARIQSLIARIPTDGGSRLDLASSEQLPCHQEFDGFADIYGRMAWDRVAPTITTGFVNPSKGRFLHPDENRTITVREGAILQSFRRTYRFPMDAGKYPVAALIGNAVPPRFVRAQAREIRKFLASTHNEYAG